jgi:TolB-like protein/Flp pilus assembly protein TadD
LRQAFLSCDDGQPYVDTIPRKGYRLVAPVVRLDETGAAASKNAASPSRQWLAFLIISLSAAAILLIAYRKSSVSDSETHSIAVLPFVNMSPDPNQEHFADGLAEELLNSLAAVDDLRVISRTSSFAFKERNASTAEIAAALHVDHIVEGSVRRAGDTVRVTAQLIDTSSDSHIWSDSYDRELNLTNILDIQDEIAAKVVNALNLRLLPQESLVLAGDGPSNLRALDLYHDGMFYLRMIEIGRSVSRTTFDAATEKFEAAIAADPDWAPSHAALGRVYHFRLGNLDDPDPAENLRVSMRYVMQAIRLDKNYGPAYGSLGYVLGTSGDYDGAMRAFDRARALNHDVSWGNAILMMGLGRYDEAIDEYENAASLAPLSTSIKSQLAGAYFCAGRYVDAIEAIEHDDGVFVDESVIAERKPLLSEAYFKAGEKRRGLQIAFELAEEAGNELYVAYLFALAGEIERARSILSSQEISGTDAFLKASWSWAVLGDEDQTLTMLERAAESAWSESQPLFVLETIHCSPEIQRFAGNPRYEALLDQLGIPD